jgi:hypothetical protein
MDGTHVHGPHPSANAAQKIAEPMTFTYGSSFSANPAPIVKRATARPARGGVGTSCETTVERNAGRGHK